MRTIIEGHTYLGHAVEILTEPKRVAGGREISLKVIGGDRDGYTFSGNADMLETIERIVPDMVDGDLWATGGVGVIRPMLKGDLFGHWLNAVRELRYLRVYVPAGYGPDDHSGHIASNVRLSFKVYDRPQSEAKGCYTLGWVVIDEGSGKHWFEHRNGERQMFSPLDLAPTPLDLIKRDENVAAEFRGEV